MAKSVAVFVDNGCDKVTVPDLYKSDLTTDSAASQRATGSANGLFDDYFASRSDGGHGRVLSDPQSAFLRTTVLSVITLSDSDDDSESFRSGGQASGPASPTLESRLGKFLP